MALKAIHRWLITLLIVVTLFAAYRLTLHLMVKAGLNAIHKQGYPVTLAELDTWYPQLPSSENAAVIYAQAFTNLHQETGKQRIHLLEPSFGDYNTEWPKRTGRLDADTRLKVQKCLVENQDALKFLHQAAALNKARYLIDLTGGIDSPLPHLAKLRFSAQLLAFEATLSAENGDLASAIHSTRDCFAAGRSLVNEPVLISQIVRGTIFRTGVKTLEHVVNVANVTDADLASLDPFLGDDDIPYAMPRALIGQRCIGIDFFSRVRTNRLPKEELDAYLGGSLCGQPPIPRLLFPLYKMCGILDLDFLEFQKLLESYISLSETPAIERKNAAVAMSQMEEDCLQRWWNHFSAIMMPDISSSNRIQGNTEAELAIARVALAVERSRIANGKIPDKIEELSLTFIQRIPPDPFDGQPLRYKKLAKGYVVYSVGEDGKDDGGDEKKDITFTVER